MDNDIPLVSVIVPNYNHEKYLVQRLETIFNQSYTNIEVILLDDCSTDSSANILSQYAKHSKVSYCVVNSENSGNTFMQWNKGINLAKGNFIWIAESDDFSSLEFIKDTLQPLLKDEKIVLSYCQSNKVNENSEVKGNWQDHTDEFKNFFLHDFVIDGNEFIKNFLIFKNVIPNASAVIFRKDHIKRIGCLSVDPMLKYNGDWLFYLKMVANNKVAFLKEPLNYFRFHSESVIASSFDSKTLIYKIKVNIELRKAISAFLAREKKENFKSILKLNNQLLKEYRIKLLRKSVSNILKFR